MFDELIILTGYMFYDCISSISACFTVTGSVLVFKARVDKVTLLQLSGQSLGKRTILEKKRKSELQISISSL